MTTLIWEAITEKEMPFNCHRTAVPGGWLVVTMYPEGGGASSVFVADAAHEWGYSEQELRARKAAKDAQMARAYEEVVPARPASESDLEAGIF